VAVSDNSTALTMPTSVTLAAGATTGSFTAIAGTVTANQAVTVVATLNGSTATALVTVTPPPATVTGMSCTPTSVTSGGNTSCTATISQAAPTGGTAVALSSSNTALTVPASVTVGAGATTGTFTATAGTVTTNQSVTIMASLNGSSKTASVTVMPPAATVTGLTCMPTSVASGGSSTCTVTISQAAPTGGTAVAVSDNSTALTTPTSVTVTAGAIGGSFTAIAGTVTANQSAVITASLNGSSTTVTITITPVTGTGLVTAYSFSEGKGTTTADSSGNGNAGTLSGTTTWTTNGKYGSALVFNGKSSMVSIPDSSSLHLTNGMTLEVWVNPSNPGNGWQDLVCKGNNNYYLDANNSDASGGGIFGGINTNVNAKGLTKGVWTHLAETYDGSSLRLYVNGAQIASTAASGNIASSTYPLQIGGDSIFGHYFKGIIDEVRVYSRALSQAEIQSDMNTTMAAPTPAMVSGNITPAVVAAETDTPRGAVRGRKVGNPAVPRGAVSMLTCSPTTVSAGAEATCELQTTAGAAGIELASSSDAVQVPEEVSTRGDESQVVFRVPIDPATTRKSVTISARVNGTAVQHTIDVEPSPAPVLTVPRKQAARSGALLSFTVSAVDPSLGMPVQFTAVNLPRGAFFDATSGHLEWTPDETQGGEYRVTFTATNAAQRSTSTDVTIEVDSGTH
jgi:Concanavalin A-like lectin/glucanases superfamily/Putative Ig domain